MKESKTKKRLLQVFLYIEQTASKSIQRHNGTLGPYAAKRLPRLQNSPIERNLTPPSVIPPSPSTHSHFLHPLVLFLSLYFLNHAPALHPRPSLHPAAHISPPYIINPTSLPLYTFYTLYTSTQTLYTFVYTVRLSLSPLYAIRIYVAFTIFYRHCSHHTTLLLIIMSHSSTAVRIVRL